MKMVAVKEILRGRGHFVDVVSEDGDVLPVDLAEDLHPVAIVLRVILQREIIS